MFLVNAPAIVRGGFHPRFPLAVSTTDAGPAVGVAVIPVDIISLGIISIALKSSRTAEWPSGTLLSLVVLSRDVRVSTRLQRPVRNCFGCDQRRNLGRGIVPIRPALVESIARRYQFGCSWPRAACSI
jgi:hypothetical protein